MTQSAATLGHAGALSQSPQFASSSPHISVSFALVNSGSLKSQTFKSSSTTLVCSSDIIASDHIELDSTKLNKIVCKSPTHIHKSSLGVFSGIVVMVRILNSTMGVNLLSHK